MPTSRQHGEDGRLVSTFCPNCDSKLLVTITDTCKPLALAYFDGTPMQGAATTDAMQLLDIAAWLDKIDRAAEQGIERATGKRHEVGHGIQDTLRDIAGRLR